MTDGSAICLSPTAGVDQADTPRSNSHCTTWTIGDVSIDHYENFPVASVLCPPSLRPAVSAIYHFARTADDIADEGSATPTQRFGDLASYRCDLLKARDGGVVSTRWPHVFGPLQNAIARHSLPVDLLQDLLDAFEQDIIKTDYPDRAELLDYCRRSANPVGRLLLHLYGIDNAQALRRSDAICTALQLANFWQDLSVDIPRGRLYLPASDRVRRRVDTAALLAQTDGTNVRALVADMVEWTRQLMLEGAPLVHSISGRAGWELRLVVQGGLRILEKITAMNFASLQARPTLRGYDAPLLAWRALRMPAPRRVVASEPA